MIIQKWVPSFLMTVCRKGRALTLAFSLSRDTCMGKNVDFYAEEESMVMD